MGQYFQSCTIIWLTCVWQSTQLLSLISPAVHLLYFYTSTQFHRHHWGVYWSHNASKTHVTSSSMLRPSVSCQNEDGGLCCYSAKPAGFTLQIYFSWTIFCSKRWQIYWIIICWCKVSNLFEGVCSKNVVNCSKPSWLTSGILVFRRFN